LIIILNGFFFLWDFNLCLGRVFFTAVDNTVMLYRDLTQMGGCPIEVYQGICGIITFVILLGI